MCALAQPVTAMQAGRLVSGTAKNTGVVQGNKAAESEISKENSAAAAESESARKKTSSEEENKQRGRKQAARKQTSSQEENKQRGRKQAARKKTHSCNVNGGAATSKALIVAAKDNTRDPQEPQGISAHDTGLHGHIQSALGNNGLCLFDITPAPGHAVIKGNKLWCVTCTKQSSTKGVSAKPKSSATSDTAQKGKKTLHHQTNTQEEKRQRKAHQPACLVALCSMLVWLRPAACTCPLSSTNTHPTGTSPSSSALSASRTAPSIQPSLKF